MSTPAKTTTEPKVVEPDDLLSIAAAEAAKNEPEGGETDVNPGSGEGVEPSNGGGSTLPAPIAPGTAVAISSTALQAFTSSEWAGFDDDGGLLNWQHVGFSIPRIVSDMRPGGGWTDEVTNVKATELDVIVIAAMPTRAWWEEEFGTGSAAPDCRSLDMIRPDAASPKKQSGTCATCPHSQWGADNEPPACSERINTLVYLPETGEVRRLTIGGTSVKHFRRYASALQARAGRKPIYAQVTKMTLEEVSNTKMRWLEAHYVAGDSISPAEALQTIKPMKDTLVEQWKSLLAEALASGEADGSAVAAGDAIDVDGREKYADEEPF